MKRKKKVLMTTLGFRVTEKTRRQLERAAQQNGRSLSAEIEFRVAISFAIPDFYQWLCEEVNGGMGLK